MYLAEVIALEEEAEAGENVYEAADELLQRIQQSYDAADLTEEEYNDLLERLALLLVSDAEAEAADGFNWLKLKYSGWFEEYSSYTYPAIPTPTLPAMYPNGVPTAGPLADTSTTADAPSDTQVDEWGGENSDENVTVSKTIDGTDIENVFDITLTVTTKHVIEEVYTEPDMAVVIVMDISNTMNSNFGSTTRYKAAMEAAENFLDQFAANANGISKVGYVAFNTDAHQIFALSDCSTTEQANALKNTMRTATGAIINAAGYKDAHTRFTNVEAGLKMGYDMISQAANENKYIIFLSDGFPTTYVSSGYTGFDPYTESGTKYADGVFYDGVRGVYCTYGTSYSEKAAIRAREMATQIKANGVKIFSIGVDVAGQTIHTHIQGGYTVSSGVVSAKGHSIVDCPSGGTVRIEGTTVYYDNVSWEIGDASSDASYKSWLRNSIGSGYYYDSTNADGLQAAYDEIFKEILKLKEQGSAADWVAEDPLHDAGMPEVVEFIGFYNQAGQLVEGDLVAGSTVDENTAAFNATDESIDWDLKNSVFTTTSVGSETYYHYKLVYRVRLENEEDSFVENAVYKTNGTTTLTYRVRETIDGLVKLSERKTIAFPIPAVHGYLVEFAFTKVDDVGKPVVGAQFTLTHADACDVCMGNAAMLPADESRVTQVAVGPFTATSDATGLVSFTEIPSGHTYFLEETQTPAGFVPNDASYKVVAAYDVLTLAAVDAATMPALTYGGTYPNERVLVDFEFTKVDDKTAAPLAGAVFRLSHAEDCELCTDAANPLVIDPFTAASGEDGKVSFTGIPSGHTYILEETRPPVGYISYNYTYRILAAHDGLTFTPLRNAPEWNADNTYVNYSGVKLPATGGSGTALYTLAGLLLCSAACLLYSLKLRGREGYDHP